MIKNIYPDTTVNDRDVNKWFACCEKDVFPFKTDEEIRKSVTKLSNNEEEEERQVEEQKTEMHEEGVSHFNRCLKWTAENNLREEEVIKFLQNLSKKK